MAGFHSEAVESLYKVILELKTEEECRKFFEDICTIKEIQDMSQRLEVARMLDSGMNYQDITKQSGVSTATISRVNRCLNYGGGGYRSAIERLNRREKENESDI